MDDHPTLSRDLSAELARLTGTNAEDWFLVYRARYGVETVLRVLGGNRGNGEVITQPFTCATAVNPILSAGLTPVYTDASYDTLSLDTSRLREGSESRAIIMQHSFGIESDMKTARKFADKHGLLLIEDSAHQVGMMAKSNEKILADVSIHSFGVEKLLPTKFGGAVWVNPNLADVDLLKAMRSSLGALPIISQKQSGLVRRYRLFNRILNHAPRFIEPVVRSFVVRVGAFQPAIMPDELEGKNHDTSARPDVFILKEALHALKQYTTISKIRAQATKEYRDSLATIFTMPNLPNTYAPARFPVLCRDAAEASRLFAALRVAGYYSGKWYRPTLFPGVKDTSRYNYDPSTCPVAEDIALRIVNLPTNITATEAKEIVHVLQREANR